MSDGAGVSAPAAAPAPSAPAASPAAPSTPAATPSTSPVVSSTAAAPAANEPPPKPKRAIVVNGQTREVDDVPDWLVDGIGEDNALSLRRLRAAGHTAQQEAARIRQEAESRLARLKNPDSVMDGLMELYGGNAEAIDAAMERFYTQRLREQEMTPEQRELQQLRKQRDEQLKSRAQQEAEAKAAQSKAVREEYAAKARAALPDALKSVGLPHTKAVVQRIAAHARQLIESGEDADRVMTNMASVARSVKAEMLEEQRELYGSMDGASLAELLGEEKLRALRAHDVERVKAAQAAAAPVVRAPDGRFSSPAAAANGEPKVGLQEFFRRRREA